MKVKDIMTRNVVHIRPEESVQVAARTLAQYNIGILPVCSGDGSLCGLVTDRDLVTRCMAANRSPADMSVREVMTGRVVSAEPDMEVGVAAHMMGRQQVRRLPVLEKGRLCGMVSLGDLAGNEECSYDAADALSEISGNYSSR